MMERRIGTHPHSYPDMHTETQAHAWGSESRGSGTRSDQSSVVRSAPDSRAAAESLVCASLLDARMREGSLLIDGQARERERERE